MASNAIYSLEWTITRTNIESFNSRFYLFLFIYQLFLPIFRSFLLVFIDFIDEPLPIVIIKSNSFSFNSYLRGCHAYIKIWNPVDGALLVCTRETDNPHDNYAVSIIRNSYVVGHVPLGLSKTFSNFLSLPVSTMLCIVTVKRLNRGAGLRLEILVMHQARGHEKAL